MRDNAMQRHKLKFLIGKSPHPNPRLGGEGLVDKDNSMAEGSQASAASKKTALTNNL